MKRMVGVILWFLLIVLAIPMAAEAPTFVLENGSNLKDVLDSLHVVSTTDKVLGCSFNVLETDYLRDSPAMWESAKVYKNTENPAAQIMATLFKDKDFKILSGTYVADHNGIVLRRQEMMQAACDVLK